MRQILSDKRRLVYRRYLPICGSYKLVLESIISIDHLPVHRINSRATNVSRWQHLKDVHLQCVDSDRVGLLIGCDIPALHAIKDQRSGSSKEPFAVKTVLGWLLRGPTGPRETPILRVNALVADLPSLESLIRQLYDQDFQELGDQERIQP